MLVDLLAEENLGPTTRTMHALLKHRREAMRKTVAAFVLNREKHFSSVDLLSSIKSGKKNICPSYIVYYRLLYVYNIYLFRIIYTTACST